MSGTCSEPLAPAVLLVEDDLRLAQLTATYLRQNGFAVHCEHRGDGVAPALRQGNTSIIILDLTLPDTDGILLCQQIREQYDGPILMLTARDSNIDQVIGLEAGADDYVTKPVDPMVLVARIRALLRRREARQPAAAADIHIGALTISQSARAVSLNGAAVPMSTQEYALLVELATNAGQVCSRESLMRATRGIPYDGLDRSIDGRVSKLRKKLNDSSSDPHRIKTVWGQGYLLVPDAWET